MVAVVLFGATDILLAFLICHPLSMNWDPTTPGGYCGNEEAAYLAAHSFNFIGDFSLALLPLPALWKLQMPTRKKVQISFMFMLGILYVL